VADSQLVDSIESLGTLDNGDQLLRLSCSLDYQPQVVEGEKPNSQWLMVTPAGKQVARDSRTFTFADLTAICGKTELPLLVDYEHLSEQPDGSTRAAGWIEDLVPDETGSRFGVPGIYARVEWTPQGLEDVSTLAYRFLSPVILVSGQEAVVSQLISVALTNTPALHMTSIDQVRARFSRLGTFTPQKERMLPEQLKALCATLGVDESADDSVIVEASTTLKAMCAKLSTELQEARATVTSTQAELAEIKAQSFRNEVEATLAQASKDGKVTPAQASKYREFCSNQQNLTLFKDVVLPSLPALCGAAPKSVPGTDDGILLDSPVVEHLKSQGLTEAQIKQATAHNKASKSKRGQHASVEE
jgi:phage I-like protein